LSVTATLTSPLCCVGAAAAGAAAIPIDRIAAAEIAATRYLAPRTDASVVLI